MLTPYRRHEKSCEHRAAGRGYRRCKCPMWVDGFLGNRELRQSLKTRDWAKAQDIIREWEAAGKQSEPEVEPMTVEQAWKEFFADAEARKLKPPTLGKYKLLRRRMEQFAREFGLRYLREFDLTMCRKFRASWPLQNLAALKTLERLRAFFRFAMEAGWIAAIPTVGLKNPKTTNAPTLPFNSAELSEILGACDVYRDHHPKAGEANALRLRAFISLLRYSGLRIRDAVTLERHRVTDGKLFLYQAKTGTAVYCPLPPFVVALLEALPTEKYFFWTGRSDPKSAVGDWQRTLRRLFALTRIVRGHAHRFRDTFAVELLLAGVPLERVSMLLGHQSTKVTEKHYTPWVLARQEQLEADVRRTWSTPELTTKGTPGVHGGTPRSN
jgi:integrase/recombinase XerD